MLGLSGKAATRQADHLGPDLFGVDQVVDAEFSADLHAVIVEDLREHDCNMLT